MRKPAEKHFKTVLSYYYAFILSCFMEFFDAQNVFKIFKLLIHLFNMPSLLSETKHKMSKTKLLSVGVP